MSEPEETMKKLILTLLPLALVVSANTWSDAEAIVDTDAMEFTSCTHKHSLVVGPDGTLHLVFFSDHEIPGNREIYYMNRKGSIWSEPLRLSHAEGNSHEPTIAVDGRGNLTVVWYDYRFQYPHSDLFWCRYDAATGTWTEDEPLIVTDGTDTPHPVAVAEPGGKVHLVWSDGRSGQWMHFELYYTFYENGHWAPEVQLTDVGVNLRWYPTVVLDDYGSLHLFWNSEHTGRNDWYIHYRRMSPDGDWGEEVDLGPGGIDDAAIYDDHLYLTHWYVPEEEGISQGIVDPVGYIRVMYSAKSLFDPDDVWVVRSQRISVNDELDAQSAALAPARNGMRVVWLEGNEFSCNLYQATVGINGHSTPENIGPIIGYHGQVSLSSGLKGDLNMVYLFTTDVPENRDIYYRHDAVPREGGFSEDEPRVLINSLSPNPASDRAVLELELVSTGDADVAVYDLAGRRVETVYRGTMIAGRHELAVETGELSSGAYFIQASIDGHGTSVPLVVTR
jgi:hypothetical protein